MVDEAVLQMVSRIGPFCTRRHLLQHRHHTTGTVFCTVHYPLNALTEEDDNQVAKRVASMALEIGPCKHPMGTNPLSGSEDVCDKNMKEDKTASLGKQHR